MAYQQGSVWSFDNSLIVSGLRRYGEDAAALRIAGATLNAARLPFGPVSGVRCRTNVSQGFSRQYGRTGAEVIAPGTGLDVAVD